MIPIRKRKIQRTRSRSRSVTPGPAERPIEFLSRRQLVMDMPNQADELLPPTPTVARSSRCQRMVEEATKDSKEPEVHEEPRLWRPRLMDNSLQGFSVERTPGGSIHVKDPIPLKKTPGGSVRRKMELEQSHHVMALERAAACDMDEEEGIDAEIYHADHLRKWLGDLPPAGCFDAIPPSPSMPVTTKNCESAVTVEVVAVEESRPGCSGEALSQFSVAQVDAVPSTSGVAGALTRHAGGSVSGGSNLDSDFDDEFDLEKIAAAGGMDRGIPADEDLDEPERVLIGSLERAMDDAIEQLVGVSGDFTWQEDFDSFRGVPETFSGPTPGAVKDFDTPYNVFTEIWDKAMIEHIVKETNRYAKQVIDAQKAAGTMKPNSRLHRWQDTDVDEIYVFFAIYLFMGIDARTSQHEYWKSTGFLAMHRFPDLMTYNRFILLNKFIHFSNNSDQGGNSSKNEGRLRKIAPVLDHLNAKYKELYNLHQDIAIDESLTLFKGRLSWVQAIRSKAARFGIKSYELCESRTGYLYNFEIYTGKDSGHDDVVTLSADLAGKSTQVVLRLLEGLQHLGHCVTMDNFYNSPSLARYLKSLGFDCLGTLRPNRKNVPMEIAKAPKNVPKGTIIARHSGDVSCLAWKDTKMVTMISTFHDSETYVGRKAGKELVKPVVVRDYNNTMGGVDLKDQKLSMYLVERKRCVKFYMKIFKRMLNISVHNALILLLSSLKRRQMPLLTHREFRERLANSLAMVHRPSLQENPAPLMKCTRLRKDILHVPQIVSRNDRKRCHICARDGKISKKVTTKCVTCDEFLCFEGCWTVWHTVQDLPGKQVHVRRRRRT